MSTPPVLGTATNQRADPQRMQGGGPPSSPLIHIRVRFSTKNFASAQPPCQDSLEAGGRRMFVAGMWKQNILKQPFTAHAGRVVEPELDMRRAHPRFSTLDRLYSWVRKLMPKEAGSPRRAIARELEESWPSTDRG